MSILVTSHCKDGPPSTSKGQVKKDFFLTALNRKVFKSKYNCQIFWISKSFNSV